MMVIYELCQNTRDSSTRQGVSREMNGKFFVYKKFEIVKYIQYNKNDNKNIKYYFGRGYVYSIQYHIVWCVKYRRYIQTQKER